MNGAIFSLIGAVVGSIISASVSWVTTRMKIKQDEISHNRTIELDREKVNRVEDLERLNYFLKKVLIIYNENAGYIEVGDLKDKKFYGKGLTFENAEKLIHLFDNNLQFIDLEILDIYLELKNSHYYDKQINANYQDNQISNNIFDQDHKLFNAVRNEAFRIEKKHGQK